jgi:hypothetical protein
MKLLKHITGQPFVFTTGLAALIHSTWSLGTLFAGSEPSPQFSPAWFAWVIPALLIAFSLDVGQIVTSAEIRAGQRQRTKYLTFLVFAAATYYLQWLYISHHMPVVELAPGVRASWAEAASWLRDSAIWFIPALLPMSTTLYTFSHSEIISEPKAATPPPIPVVEIPIAQPTEPNAAQIEAPDPTIAIPAHVSDGSGIKSTDDGRVIYRCQDCGFENTYSNPLSAANGKRAHDRHCKVKNPAVIEEPS